MERRIRAIAREKENRWFHFDKGIWEPEEFPSRPSGSHDCPVTQTFPPHKLFERGVLQAPFSYIQELRQGADVLYLQTIARR
jgi:hypothetical protein